MSINITPEELAGMTDADLDRLRRQVLDARDQRVHAERTQEQRQAERVRAANVVRDEIRAYIVAGGAPEQLHALLDRVVEHIEAQQAAAAARGVTGGGQVG